MASEPVYTTLHAALVAAFPAVTVLRWEDVEDSGAEQGDVPFFAMEEEVSAERPVSIGSPTVQCIREAGSMMVHVFTPAGQPLSAARYLGDQVRVALRRFQSAAPPGWLRLQALHPPTQELVNIGRWSSMTVIIDYQFDVAY